jgi:hypothetical protein
MMAGEFSTIGEILFKMIDGAMPWRLFGCSRRRLTEYQAGEIN